MSFNQSRTEKNESSHYRKLGRSGSSNQPRNFSGNNWKGGGGGGNAAPPSSPSVNPSLAASNRSFKKTDNNAQGVQSRANIGSVNTDSNNNSAARTVQNGAHLQPQLRGPSDAPVTGMNIQPPDASQQKSAHAIHKAPTHPVSVSPDTVARTTPVKASGDVPRSFPLQFGSISPGFVNGMQIPARTSSAPPNLDEQKRDQARNASLRAVPTLPIPSASKQLTKKDTDAVDQSNTTGEAPPIPKAKMEVQVSSAPPVTQLQKPSIHPVSGIPMQMPFHQSQVPIQFGGPNQSMQSQGMSATSMPLAMPIPLSIGNPQVQQQVFVPSLQPHSIQPQGIMHQGQPLNFSSQMGPQLPPQLGNMGMNLTSQFPQHQPGIFGGSRKIVKITHPETHEELRLDRKTESYTESGSSGPRSHPNVPPQSQPIQSFPPPHPINFYPNSYNASSLYFTVPGSLPVTNSQITPNSQAPVFSYPVSQGPQTVPFVSPPTLNSFSINKAGAPLPTTAEASNLEHARSSQNVNTSAPVKVTVKPAVGLSGEKAGDFSSSAHSHAIEKNGSVKLPKPHGEVYSQRGSEASSRSSSQQPKHGSEPTTNLLPMANKLHVATSGAESLLPNASSAVPTLLEESSSVAISGSEGKRRETFGKSDSMKDQQKRPGAESHPQSLPQAGGQSTVHSVASQSSDHSNTVSNRTPENIEAKTTHAPSGSYEGAMETIREPLLTTGNATTAASDLKTNSSTSFSLEMNDGVKILSDNLDSDHHSQRDAFFRQDEQQKPGAVGINGKAENMFPKGTEVVENIHETSLASISSEPLEAGNKAEQKFTTESTTADSEVGPLEKAKGELEDGGTSTGDSRVAYNSTSHTSEEPDAVNAENPPSDISLSTSYHGDKTSSLDVCSGKSDNIDREVVAKSGTLESVSSSFSAKSLSEVTLKVEGTENITSGLTSSLPSIPKDKVMLEPNKAKGNIVKGKKKRKEFLQKADSLGTTSDLYGAYKGPEGKMVASAEITESDSSSNLQQIPVDTSQDVISKKREQSKAEPDDWEDAADVSSPVLEPSDTTKQHYTEDGSGVLTKKYSRDFLLKFSEHCNDLPEGFEITSDIAEVLMISNATNSYDSYPSPGRVIDRPTGGSRSERRGRGTGEDDRWNKMSGAISSARDMRLDIGLGGNVGGFRPGQGGNFGVLRNPGAQTPMQYAGGILSGPMQSMGSQGGGQRNSADSDRWQRAPGSQKGLIPSPQTPLQVMHKAERKYEVGKITDEEQAKQRQLKGILNKLTPQNFEKLFEQVKAVNIDNAATLTGVISQIFDKALMEPTFCEMYANFCYHLAGELPDFSEDNEKITFKRLLLNKCQEEFERGEREQEEANRAEEEGQIKQSEEEREEKRLRARRRMLGNIRLIGELYKKKMLTERIMHECIKKLLGQFQNHDEEDIESLCKLMSTIGEMIDHPKAKVHMDAYFDRMAALSDNMELSSRVRFMLRDAIDLRKNKWQQRRKVEGPKKIEEVHRDAAQERQATSKMARGPLGSSARRGQPMDFGQRGSNLSHAPNAQMGSFRGQPMQQPRGYANQDVRSDARQSFENRTVSVPLNHRPMDDDSITLGPQGGLARGMSFRGQQPMSNIPLADMPSPGDSRRMPAGPNNYTSVSERAVYISREDPSPRHIPEKVVSGSSYDQSSMQDRNINYGIRDLRNADHNSHRSHPTSPPTRGRAPISAQNDSDKLLPEERLQDMSMATIKEFYSAKDVKEVALCIKDMNSPSFSPSMISIWVTDSFERKDMERGLLAKLLIDLTKSQDVVLSQEQLMKGFESVLASLEDAVNDAPRAAEFLGHMFAKVILDDLVPFTQIAQLIYEGGEEQGRLVEIGLAAEVVGSILEVIKSEKGETALTEINSSSSLRLEKFRPPDSKKSLRLDKFI